MSGTTHDWLKHKTETSAASALRLLVQLKSQIESGDYSLAQVTCETVQIQLESAKWACNTLADIPDVAMIKLEGERNERRTLQL